MSLFEQFRKEQAQKQEAEKSGSAALPEEDLSGQASIRPSSNPPRRDSTLYGVYNPQMMAYKPLSLEAASDNSVASGKYLTSDGELAELNTSGFRTAEGRMFGANGLVYVKPLEGHAAPYITERTEGTFAEFMGKMAAQLAAQYDPDTPLRVLVPGINPENGQPILREEIGTRKELLERNVALTQAFGFQSKEDGLLKSFTKGLLDMMRKSDEVVLGAANVMTLNTNPGLKHALALAVEKNNLYSFLPSKESGEPFTWDWFGSGLGSALASQAQFGVAGRLGGSITSGALRLGGKAAFENFARREVAEKLARYGASATIGFGYAMSEAKRAGLDDSESWMFATAVGGINALIESRLNVDFDRMLMGSSTRVVTRGLLRELNGEVTSQALNRAGKTVLSSVLAGGKTALKAAGSEALEEVLQTGVEQSGRTFHELFSFEREKNKGRFEQTGYRVGEVLEAGFFGAVAGGMTSFASGMARHDPRQSYMEKMIRQGRGNLILSGIDNLLATGKVDARSHEQMKKQALFGVEVFEKNKEAFFNLRKMTDSERIQKDLFALFRQKAAYSMQSEALMAQLGKNPDDNPAISRAEAEAVRRELASVDAFLSETQQKIDRYKDRGFVESENARHRSEREAEDQLRSRVFEQLQGPEATAGTFDEILSRYRSMSEQERQATPLFRNATEAKILLDGVRNGEAASLFEGGDIDTFLESVGQQLKLTRFYLHPSVNTDHNRKLLTDELGIEESMLPLTASERSRALSNPAEFEGRYLGPAELEGIFAGEEFGAALEKFMAEHGMDRASVSPADLRLAMYQLLVSQGRAFGVTDGMLHSLDATEQVLSLLATDGQRTAFRELLEKSDKPFALLTDQKEAGEKTSGFHYAGNGAVYLRFNRARLEELLAKKTAAPLSSPEQAELKSLQDDLFHKLVHETAHNFFDYGINSLYHNYLKDPSGADGLLYRRLLDLGTLAYHRFKDDRRHRNSYFFSTVGAKFFALDYRDRLAESSTFIREFFAEALSNPEFQQALDSFDLSSKSNAKMLARYYHYPEVGGGTVKSLLREVLDAFHGVMSRVAELLTPGRRTLLREAMVLGSNIRVNRYSLHAVEEVASVANMDISLFNPKLLIDQQEDYTHLDALPFVISRRLAEEGFVMEDSQYEDFKKRISDYLKEEIASRGEESIEAQTLRVVYFRLTDSFLLTHRTVSPEGRELVRRQFFNRYGNRESLNTNVFNGDKESHLKKHYTFDDYDPRNDLDKTAAEKRQVSDWYRAALAENFSGEAVLSLNEERIFGTREQKFRGEVEIVYTFADGSRRVIGYAPDLAKPRLARMLKLGAVLPVRLETDGPGSRAFVLYNTPGDPSSGIRRAVNPKSLRYRMSEEMIAEGYVEEKGFMPRTVFRYDVANVRVVQAVRETADVQDSLTTMDESLPVDLSQVRGLSDENFLRHEFDSAIAGSVLGEDFSFYRDLDTRKDFDGRVWFYRERIRREITYRAMTGIYTSVQLEHAAGAMVNLSARELKTHAGNEIETERADRLGFVSESDFKEFIRDMLSPQAMDAYRNKAETGIRQDWSGHGLNPDQTVFAMVKAQIEHLSYTDPATGKKQVLDLGQAREVLLMASREASTFTDMVERIKSIAADPKMDSLQKEIARTLHTFYASPVTEERVAERISQGGINKKTVEAVSELAASMATGPASFRNALAGMAENGIPERFREQAQGLAATEAEVEVKAAASALLAHYSSPGASYNGLVRYFGSNSLYTAFASLRKVDSIALIPVSGGASIVSYNGKSRVREGRIAENQTRIRKVLDRIKKENPQQKKAQEALHQLIKDTYNGMFAQKHGPFPAEFNNLGTALYYNQFFARPGKLSGLDATKPGSISDAWMQETDPAHYGKLVRVLKAFYAAFEIDLPNGMLLRHPRGDAGYFSDLENRMDMEFLEQMAEEEIAEGSPEYETAFARHQEYKRKHLSLMEKNRYVYPLSRFGKKTAPKSPATDNGNHPTLALALQAAHFLNTKALSFFGGDDRAELMGDEMKKLSEEQILFGRINQSDDMYFDPKGNKRFSVKIKSRADALMEELSMDRDGLLTQMLSSPQWEHSTVLKKISENRGKPIDLQVSGLRARSGGTIYSESTDLDFVYMNLAGFTSLYDYTGDYIHLDDIPSDKPTLYGYRLSRITREELSGEIDRINSTERRKRILAKKLLREAFTDTILRRKGEGAQIRNREVFDTLVEGVHYTVRNGRYYPGKILESSKSFFGGDRKATAILSELKAEARMLYGKIISQGLEIPLNRAFVRENDPAVLLETLRRELFGLESSLERYPEGENGLNREQRREELQREIAMKEASMQQDQAAYAQKAARRRQEIFVEEFYPNYVINRYHLSRLLMGDAAFYKDVFDMNKRKAGPAAPFYRGSWKRAQGRLVALEDVGEEKDKTLVNLPRMEFSPDHGGWQILESANELATARTDAQGYVTEQFAAEMVDAYGAFSGFKKIFKPVMFGVNREYLDRAQPLYIKLSVAVIPDPNDPVNASHYERYPAQLDFARKFYASGGDMAIFRTGVKAGFKNSSRVEDESYAVQPFDLDKFGLQNDPEKSVEDQESEIAGGVQLHKQLADNENFHQMLAYYQLEAELLRKQLNEALDSGVLSDSEQLRAAFISELENKSHTAELGDWLSENSTELFDHPFTSEAVQNMAQSLFNRMGTLPKKPGKKLVNLSDYGFDRVVPDSGQIAAARAFAGEDTAARLAAEGYVPRWAGPRKQSELHPMDLAEFTLKVKDGEWLVDGVDGYIYRADGEPVVFPADVLVPENAGLPLGTRMINTRIPTTGKASNIPSRVVGFLPSALGNVIVTPKEGPGILGFDFDVDGLFAWHHTGGHRKDMDSLFEIAFSVLTHPKNYNELTSPVGTDLLRRSANFYSVPEDRARAAWENGEEISQGENNPNGLLPYGFARQLELMKMNSVGKVFIGASASFSAIYSVFSQTGVALNSSRFVNRSHRIPGAKVWYPTVTESGRRITDVFVQLINAATDNVKEMLLAKNNINLVTGDVVMDLVAHGVDLDYALAFVNQPAIRDLVRLNDRNESVVTGDDFMAAEDRLMERYADAVRLVMPEFVWKPEVFKGKGIADVNEFSYRELLDMYFSGNKQMGIGEVSDPEALRAFIGKNLGEQEASRELARRLIAQIRVLEKFKYYRMLAGITRQGGTLVMMYSKNPKNYTELNRVIERIENTFLSENPKLTPEVFEHPSYRLQWELLGRNREFYRSRLLVADPDIRGYYLSDVLESVGSSAQEQVHDAFMGSLVIRHLEKHGIGSHLLTGSPMSSLEFNEILVRLLRDNAEQFGANKFMQQLSFRPGEDSLEDIALGRGEPGKIDFNGTKQFTQTELREIRNAFEDIPPVSYHGHEVDLKKALVYYLAITRGFGLGGYNFSKILPDSEGSALQLINAGILEARAQLENFRAQAAREDYSVRGKLLAETLDPLMVDSMENFTARFHLRNPSFKPTLGRTQLMSMLRKAGTAAGAGVWFQSAGNSSVVGPLRVSRDQERDSFEFVEIRGNAEYEAFLERAVRMHGFFMTDKSGALREFTLVAPVPQTEESGDKVTSHVFTERIYRQVPGIYEPYYFDISAENLYRKMEKKHAGVDISSSAKHLGEKNPTLLAHFEKDKAKFSIATKLISRGSPDSSSHSYALAAGRAVTNTGSYSAGDIVGISAEGNRRGRIGPDLIEIQKAMDAGATLITDKPLDRDRPYNIGEREVARHLTDHGYREVADGRWMKDETFIPWRERIVFADTNPEGLALALAEGSVIVATDPDLVEAVLASGYRRSLKNPAAFLSRTRDLASYSPEQTKLLKNEC